MLELTAWQFVTYAWALWFAFVMGIILFKSPLALLWWRVFGPVLEPLGFRIVCQDMSYGIYGYEYRGRNNA